MERTTKSPTGNVEQLCKRAREVHAKGALVIAKKLEGFLDTKGDDAETKPVLVPSQIVRNSLQTMSYAFEEPKRGYEPTELRKAHELEEYLLASCPNE